MRFALVLLLVGGGAWATGAGRLAAAEALPGVEPIPSPFARDGKAFVFRAPEDQSKALVWDLDAVTPGQLYSVSFFFQNRLVQDPRELEAFTLSIGDKGRRIYHQRLYSRNHAQFFTTNVVFESSTAQVRIQLRSGMEVIFGDFGREVDVADLTHVREPPSSVLWPPTLRLPDVYRGLRDFAIEVRAWASQPGMVATLNAIEVRAGMNVAAAKLPRILPGANTLHVVRDEAEPGAALAVRVTPRQVTGEPRIVAAGDQVIPADGATFGRVLLSAGDESGRMVSGNFFRLKTPPEVRAYPYARAISDWAALQTTREFHLTSLVPGEYRIGIERWTGRAWAETHQTFDVTFTAVEQPAPDFIRTNHGSGWLQPREPEALAGSRESLDLALDQAGDAAAIPMVVDSPLSPRVDWRVRGPVRRLGLHAAFQPDSRTLGELARSWRDLVVAGSDSPSRDFALGVEEYVGLNVEVVLPDPFVSMDYQSPGRLHREGRGWCNQFAQASHALMIQGGLESRLRRVPAHVMGEVRAADLAPMFVDSMLQVAVTDARGNRLQLDQLEEEGVRVIGAGVDDQTRRGSFSGYLESPLPVQDSWSRIDPADPIHRNAFLDDEVFSIDLAAWEELTWSSGSVPQQSMRDSLRRVAENQTVITKTSRLVFPEFSGHADVEVRNLRRTELGGLAPQDSEGGKVGFTFRTPVEVDNLTVTTDAMLGGGGRIAIWLRPDLPPPLMSGIEGSRLD